MGSLRRGRGAAEARGSPCRAGWRSTGDLGPAHRAVARTPAVQRPSIALSSTPSTGLLIRGFGVRVPRGPRSGDGVNRRGTWGPPQAPRPCAVSRAAGSTAPEPPAQGALSQMRILSASGPGHVQNPHALRPAHPRLPAARAEAPGAPPRGATSPSDPEVTSWSSLPTMRNPSRRPWPSSPPASPSATCSPRSSSSSNHPCPCWPWPIHESILVRTTHGRRGLEHARDPQRPVLESQALKTWMASLAADPMWNQSDRVSRGACP